MQVKAPDSKRQHVDSLKALLVVPNLTSAQRERIETEIRTTSAGITGEAQAVWEIEFHLAKSRDYMTLHDLRLECEGRVAQIDHLIVTRFFEFWVCESKAFSEGVEIDADDNWVWYHGGKPRAMESPLHQIDRHIAVLRDALTTKLVKPPTRLGISRVPVLKGVVLFSNKTHITRPTDRTKVRGLDRVLKLDQLISTLERSTEERQAVEGGRRVTQERVERIARQLAAMHRPVTFNWYRRFGLPEPVQSAARPRRATCTSCGTSVSEKVVAYCRDNSTLFEGRLLCPFCQYQVRRSKSVMHYA